MVGGVVGVAFTHLIRVSFVTFPLTVEPSFSVNVNTPPVYDVTVPAFSGVGGVGVVVVGVGGGVVVAEPICTIRNFAW